MASSIPRAVPSLVGKTVAITGATGGIGFAIARRFAQEGSKVVLLGRNSTLLQESLDRIREVVPVYDQTPFRPRMDANNLADTEKHTSFTLEVQNEDQWKQLASDHVRLTIIP